MIIILIILCTSIAVYFDAKKLGVRPGLLKSKFFDSSPMGWAIGSCVLWIVVFPLYLVQRKKYAELHTNDPTNSKKNETSTLFNAVGVLSILAVVSLGIWENLPNTMVPSCEAATQTAKQAVENILIQGNASAEVRAIINVEESGQDKATGVRVCAGTLVTTAGENNLIYTVKWQNKSKGSYYVEALVQ